MKSERVILSFIAVLVGLMVAGGTFFIYQHYMKTPPTTPAQTLSTKSVITPSPTPHNQNDFLIVDNPVDQLVTSLRNIQVSGKATKDATIIVSTPSTDQVAISSNTGTFSLSTTLDNDTNVMQITAIFPDGTEQKVTKTVTYSTETF